MVRVTVVGTGYVGLCTGLVLVEAGHHVTSVDLAKARVDAIREGRAPFFEPGLIESLRTALASGRFTVTTDLPAAVRDSEVTLLCVGTPEGADGSIDLAQVRSASADVGKALRGKRGYHVVAIKSTVVPGTCEGVARKELEAESGLVAGKDFGLASNPEFLKEGNALDDARRPDRIVIGSVDERGAKALWRLYDTFDAPRITTTPSTAETIKYVSNAFLAAKVALSNEMANVCERLGVDWYDVADGVGRDTRIGSQFLRAGVGFGGSCFPKDLAAIARVARDVGAPSGILGAVLENNDRQPLVLLPLLQEELGTLRGKKIALLGLAFKPGTDDVRSTRALPLWQALEGAGASVVAYDPQANVAFKAIAPGCRTVDTLEAALKGADAAVVQTEWKEFRDIPPARFREWMKSPVVVDGRRTFDPNAMWDAGVRYRAVGLGRRPPAPADPRASPAVASGSQRT